MPSPFLPVLLVLLSSTSWTFSHLEDSWLTLVPMFQFFLLLLQPPAQGYSWLQLMVSSHLFRFQDYSFMFWLTLVWPAFSVSFSVSTHPWSRFSPPPLSSPGCIQPENVLPGLSWFPSDKPCLFCSVLLLWFLCYPSLCSPVYIQPPLQVSRCPLFRWVHSL